MMKFGFALICVVAPLAGMSQTLSGATTANNGTGGVFMDLTAGSQNLSVLSFDCFMGATAGGAFSVEIWTRPGTYVGFSTSNVGWTLLDTASGTSVDTLTLANFALNNAISLTAGQTTGVYLQGITAGNALRYNGTTALPPVTFYSNSDLSMSTAHTRTGTVAFGGTQFTPRAFAGNVNYRVESVPEPMTMAVLGLGATALLRRRRKA